MNPSSVFVLAFAALFLIVGVLRVVEFMDVGLTQPTQGILIAIHIVGCLVFTAALAMFAIDLRQEHKAWTYGLFASGLLTLFPVHIYIALKRRQRLRDLGAR